MEYYTIDGERPDLAQLVKLSQMLGVGGYAFPKIFPMIITAETSGDYSYAPVLMTAASGQAGRENDAEITDTEIKSSTLAWATARLEGRHKIYENEVKGLGGIESADEMGGEESGRKAMNTAEKAANTLVFASRIGTATTLTDQKVLATLKTKALSLRKYGKPYLVMSTNAYMTFTGIPEIDRKFVAGLKGLGDVGFLTASDTAALKVVAGLIAFEGIILFDSDVVGTTYDDYIAVIALRPEAFGSAENAYKAGKRRAMYGLTHLYLPDGADKDMPFRISSAADRKNKVNYYDAEGRYCLSEMHGDAVEVCKFASKYTPLGDLTSKVEIVNTADNPVITDDVGGV